MEKIPVERLLEAARERTVLDVRTPAEYEKGHIPGARNLPLFSNEERAVVGTIYKQQNPEKAFLKGLEFAGAHMRWYVEEALRLAPGRKLLIHCWRGGQRSGALSWLLEFAGFDVQVLIGGYKAYRNFVLQQFADRQLKMVVLGGSTGSGKTAILKALQSAGEQVIDLEGIAHHKGSAFGALGELPQPVAEQFENDLFDVFSRIDPGRRVWVENESRAIGRVFMPEGFWNQFRTSTLVRLEVPFQQRVDYLVQIYAGYPKAGLEESFRKIETRLGGQHLKAALEHLEKDEFDQAAAIALRYYDKSYAFATTKCDFKAAFNFPVSVTDHQLLAQQLTQFADEHGL